MRMLDSISRGQSLASCVVLFLLLTSAWPAALIASDIDEEDAIYPLHLNEINESEEKLVSGREVEPWYESSQAWPQFQNNPTRNSSMPSHGPDGGPGDGPVANVSELASITKPELNWMKETSGHYGSDGLGSAIGDFSNSITFPATAAERCGEGDLFAVFVVSESSGEVSNSILKIVNGDTSKTAWQVNLGSTQAIKATPILFDLNDDGRLEIIVAYDTSSEIVVDIWSPEIACSEAGWQATGHGTEKMWSWQDSDRRLGAESPHWPVAQTGHLVTTQTLLADLQMDGSPELVLSAMDQDTAKPVVIALPLTNQGPPDALWQVDLDRGNHISDPTWVALDSQNSAVIVTTIDDSDANMWVWKIDGASGSLDWERVNLPNSDSDSNSPRLRLPGPVIAQLDDDEVPEVIFTIPTDSNGGSSGNGATLVAWELTSAEQIWTFRTPNGYSDAPPLPVDTTGDGIHDRVCWVTWYSTSSWNFDRQGLTGCHDVSGETPSKEWSRTLDQSSGNNNDEIAVAPPIWMDIDGNGAPELIVPFGRRVFAFDGDTGIQADINNWWAAAIDISHRTWAAPAAGDLDGDGSLDILIGDTVISQAVCDVSPSSDGRGISFNPETPDPGETVTITGQFSNIGTVECDEDVDAVLFDGEQEIGRYRIVDLAAVAPSGEAGPASFSVDIIAQLGDAEITLVLDPFGNITQSRRDNDQQSRTLSVVEPYDAEITIPPAALRIDPGTSGIAEPVITATGRRTAEWSLNVDSTNLPQGWAYVDQTVGGLTGISLEPGIAWEPSFSISVPSDALGDESGYLILTLTLDDDVNISLASLFPVEVLRTRGLSIVGPEGTESSHGLGRPGHDAIAWVLIENLGNAAETTSSMSWGASSWGTQPRLLDMGGSEHFVVNLNAGEATAYAVNLPVPPSASLGTESSTSLELCIGSGSEKLCRTIELRFTANGINMQPPHYRVDPDQSISWFISTDAPSLSWNLADVGMLNSGWIWTAAGDYNLSGNLLSTTSSGPATGWLNLTLPATATPQLHIFNLSEEGGADNRSLNISLQILQVYRASIEIIQPTEEPWSVTVGEQHTIVLRLSNPGNGEDIYQLTGIVDSNQNFSTDPGVIFSIADPIRTIDAGAMQTVPIAITLPLDLSARTGMLVSFILTSTADQSIFDKITLEVEAEPDHRWDLEAQQATEIIVYNEELLNLEWLVTNSGNFADLLAVSATLEIAHVSGDTSEWSINTAATSEIAVNDSTPVSLEIVIPSNTWNGTQVEITVAFSAGGSEIVWDNITLEVGRVSGWSFEISNADLEVPPEGGNISLGLRQQGNTPAQPYLAGSIGQWNITLPDNLSIVDPDSVLTISIYAQPPLDSLAGEIGTLLLISRDGDGAGDSRANIPLRVAAEDSIEVNTFGSWKVTDAGGYPLAWIENTGNSLVEINVSIDDIPSGWSVSGEGVSHIASGASAGLELNLVPAQSWDGNSFRVTVRIIMNGEFELHNITVESANISWAASPLFQGLVADTLSVEVFSPSSIESINADSTVAQYDGVWRLTLGDEGQETWHFSGDNWSETLNLQILSHTLPTRSVTCDLKQPQMEGLGTLAHNSSSTIAVCTVANGTEDFRGNMLLTTSGGVLISSTSVFVLGGEGMVVNLSSGGWVSPAGIWEIEVRMMDLYGSTVDSDSDSITVRIDGWNIGISRIDEKYNNGERTLKIGISRNGYQLMTNPQCSIELSSGTWMTIVTVDITAAGFAPEVEVLIPKEIKDGSNVNATLSCTEPWDADDDSSDDSASHTLEDTSSLADALSGSVWSGIVVVIILAILWQLNILWPRQERASPQSGQKTNSGSRGRSSAAIHDDNKDDLQELAKTQNSKGGEDVIHLEDEDGIATPQKQTLTQKAKETKSNLQMTSPKEVDESISTEPTMQAAPPSSLSEKYSQKTKGKSTDIDSRIDSMLKRRGLD